MHFFFFLGTYPPAHLHYTLQKHFNQLHLCGVRRLQSLSERMWTAEIINTSPPSIQNFTLKCCRSPVPWSVDPSTCWPLQKGSHSIQDPGICNSCFRKATTELPGHFPPSTHQSVLCLLWLKAGKEDGDPWNRHNRAYLSCPDMGPHFYQCKQKYAVFHLHSQRYTLFYKRRLNYNSMNFLQHWIILHDKPILVRE